ncbi:MAG: site-specific integrase [Gammaproteobacteria bacterium]|nr:site-specific integrase [Gammaproteobacteria bacterium]
MDESRFKFTKTKVQALPIPEQGRVTYHDTENPKLKLWVRPSGVKSFFLYRRVDGKPERIFIGRFPDFTVDKARRKAEELNGEISKGENPNDDKRKKRKTYNLQNLYDEYFKNHVQLNKKPERNAETYYRLYLSQWKNRKIDNLKNPEIRRWFAKLGAEISPATANKALGLLKAIYNKGIEWGIVAVNGNPCIGIKKFPEVKRERFLQADELPRFFKALAEEPNDTARDYFLISLLTGARRSNVLAMRWQDVNLARATWTIPKTKNGEPHTVPLVKVAVDLLTERKNLRANQFIINQAGELEDTGKESPWVFPGTGKTGHLMEPKKAWARILERAEIQQLRIHDLRRSLGSWQAATGASLSIIGKTLAHKNVSTTAIYARLNLDPVRDAMNKATDAMFEAAQVKQEAEVLEMEN